MVRAVTDDDIGVQVLREPALTESGTSDETIDILAVHGIGAHPDDTWCKNVGTKENPKWVNWLNDATMLPSVVAHARIMRFGYKSQWFGADAIKQNTSVVAQRLLLSLSRRRKENPFRPLIVVAHCFGGLVVLKALIEACHDTARWHGIFQSTTGLIFFGTPFRGAEGMSQSEMLQAALSEYEQEEVHTEVLNILDPGNELLQDLVDGFGKTRSLPNKAQVACFFELQPSNIDAIVGKQRETRFVVSESSGCLDISEATEKYSLERSHFNMNKFGKPSEEDFLTVSEVVDKMAKAAPGLLLMRHRHEQGIETILGNLRYVQDDHVWAIELGQFMGCYELVTHSDPNHQQVTELEHDINWRLSAHDIPYSVPDRHGDAGPTLTTKISQQLIRVFGPSHCAFFLIGEAACILREGMRVANDEQKSGVREVARQRLNQVRYQCTGITLDCDAFWDLLVQRNPVELTTFRLQAFLLPKRIDERALVGKAEAISSNHPSTLDTVDELGDLHFDQGKLTEAKTRYKRASEGAERAHGAKQTATLDTGNDLGNLYKAQGKLAEAEVMYKRALAGSEKTLGAEHTNTLGTVNNLGALYSDQGRLAEAEAMYTRALAGYEKALGAEHTNTLMTVNNLGALYSDQGKLVEAEVAFTRALAGYEKALGVEHADTLRTVNNLGALYSDQGKLAEAEAMYNRALAGYEKALGVEHADTLRTVNNLGALYSDQGKLAEAETMYTRALAGYEKALGAEHTDTLDTVDKLGTLYSAQGRVVEAEMMYERALAGYEQVLEAGRASRLRTVNNLCVLYKLTKDSKMLAPMLFRAALEANDVAEATRLLKEEVEAVTKSGSEFEWISEPLTMGLGPMEIVKLIIEERDEAPWIRYDLPTLVSNQINITFHRQDCIHESIFQRSPQDRERQSSVAQKTIVRVVAEMCGLGGVVPLLAARPTWDGTVTFNNTIARVSYRDTDAPEALSNDIDRTKNGLRRSLNALSRIGVLAAWLQTNYLICDRFVILRYGVKSKSIEAVSIPLRLIAELKTHLQRSLDSSDTRGTIQCQALVLETSITLLELFCGFHQDSDPMDSSDTLLCATDASAMAVQAICIGILAFSRANLGELDPFFLMHKVSEVKLCGVEGTLSRKVSLSLQLSELSCIGDMLDDSVMVFTCEGQKPNTTRHNLLTSLDNLFELWGPGQMIVDHDQNICGAVIGGGVIYQPSHDSAVLHWCQEASREVVFRSPGVRRGASDVITIGGFAVNTNCPFNQNDDKSLPRLVTASKLHTLGTFAKQWTLQEIQAGLQAGQFAMQTINMTWIKTDARTIKAAISSGDWDLDTLEAPWGLLISVCTGVAQRVPLREVIAEVMPMMLRAMRKRPHEWNQPKIETHEIAGKFRDPGFRNWHDSLEKSERDALDDIVEYILKRICWTGVNQKEELVVASPSLGDACGCIHMPREQNQALASILKDSEECATFACITARCIETDQHKCRQSHQPKWQDKASLLITSVCQYQRLEDKQWQRIDQPGLQNDRKYWMGYIQDCRRFTAQVHRSPDSPTVLRISDSMCPTSWARLAWERVERIKSCYTRLLEKHLADEKGAEEVFVLSDK